jgi:quinohemoprotein ethanol dehydrogenase
MRFGRLHLLAVVVGAFAFLAFTTAAMATPSGQNGTAAAGRAVAVPIAPYTPPASWNSTAGTDWPVVGGDYFQNRYSTLSEINTSNVSGLKMAWHIHLGSALDTQYRGEGSPIVYGGIMYMVTGNDDVYAIDATNGSIIWTYKSDLPPAAVLGPYICCGWDARGLAVGAGKVYLARLDGKLLALDQQTGGILWARAAFRYLDGYTMTMAPLYYNPGNGGDPEVIVGVSGSERGARGSISAYSAVDGHFLWRFYNVPTPGDLGSGSWPNNSEWQTGGATVWNTPTVDPVNKVMTYTTANADPWSSRGAGDDLFTSAFVALDPAYGQYLWHFQTVHHDIWDYDCPSPTAMMDATIGGVSTPVVAEPCKTGWVYELNRKTGNPVTRIDEKPVPQNAFQHTAPTQPIPAGDAFSDQCAKASDVAATAPDGKPFIVGCIWTPYDDQQFAVVAPGAGGGTVIAESSFNPATNSFLVFGSDTRLAAKAIPNASSLYTNGRNFTGFQGAGTATGFKTTGRFANYDLNSNKINWKIEYTAAQVTGTQTAVIGGAQPGTMSTAGGLFFTGLPEGVAWGIQALNASNGAVLWTFTTDAGVEAPPMTYSAGGHQYVAIYAGGRNTTTAPFVHGDSLYAFSLSGT